MRHATHFVDGSKNQHALCGEPGVMAYDASGVDCRECLSLLRIARRERRMVSMAQLQANQIIKKRKLRIARAQERERSKRAGHG